ncbi:UCS-domain-containing protein Rng3 [Schizosaccharomyces japonicus yFS275]|uniref:UCS-domain-containing protein Rng3 n=1 Tax=Schizosaccharomyces japonicus (strain yFS275 / FY16936) TaxID=402676 RepID=B6JWH4_SCHJY|nr:UCS-domain-containing protein Rng3 [Schizosaccharomyces japonicus yFS275]EEB05725.1 UCS-domain-containing protein Rng3 [Schizosaccharomyces japonicus yFS275]
MSTLTKPCALCQAIDHLDAKTKAGPSELKELQAIAADPACPVCRTQENLSDEHEKTILETIAKQGAAIDAWIDANFAADTDFSPDTAPVAILARTRKGVEIVFQLLEKQDTGEEAAECLLTRLFENLSPTALAILLHQPHTRAAFSARVEPLLSHKRVLQSFLRCPLYDSLAAVLFANRSDIAEEALNGCKQLARDGDPCRSLVLSRLSSLLLVALSSSKSDIVDKDFLSYWTRISEEGHLELAWIDCLCTICDFSKCRTLVQECCQDFLQANASKRECIPVLTKIALGTNHKDELLPMVQQLLHEPVCDDSLLQTLLVASCYGPVKECIAHSATPLFTQWTQILKQSKEDFLKGAFDESYTIASTLLHLCQFAKPVETEDDVQRNRLKQTIQSAAAKKNASLDEAGLPSDCVEDDDSHVQARVELVIKSGLIGLLLKHATDTRPGLCQVMAELLLHVANVKTTRGRLVQQGAVGFLTRSTVLQKSSVAAHAVSRILISVSPHIVFTGSLSPTGAIKLMSVLLADGESSLLALFETLLALTNLASFDESSRAAIVRDCWDSLDNLLLSSNTLVQRASTELLNNLSLSTTCLEKIFGQKEQDTENSRLRIIVALGDAEDAATRQAAFGAIVQFTGYLECCKAIAQRVGFEFLVRGLRDDDQGVRHRVLVCVCNLLYQPDMTIVGQALRTPGLVQQIMSCKCDAPALQQAQKDALSILQQISQANTKR